MATNDNIVIFLTGLAIGSIGALLLTPVSGAEARVRIQQGKDKATGYLKDRSAALVDSAGEAINHKVNVMASATGKVSDHLVAKSTDFLHSAGNTLQDAGQRLQSV